MSDDTKAACDAVAKRAAELSKDATPESLKTIAEAVAQVHYGPQGADYSNSTKYSYDNTTNTRYDYHETHHYPERGQTGFGASGETTS